ncbi:hypothetical protein GSI_06877 [Ganoderma sinense ZZ0214-1]|uniref:F-box domain-containing protein n=1 Tax=Ganoderma sinense ZZ0214-1 TaxID=1077348 RepID=A0A2G8SAC6_9APHY|nr:hypothetical protein GSI_06877 [Ganoderma sinense ZZ0214-1]
MASALCSAQHLPIELVRRISDHLVGIKKWETDAPLPKWMNAEYARPSRDREMDFIGLRTLPSLATTSHFFLEPALDALWYTLPNYGILVYLLPRDAWTVDSVADEPPDIPEEERINPPVRCVSMTRRLTEEEFKRIQYYTPRVKRIQERCPLFPRRLRAYFMRYDHSILGALAHWCSPESPLFPNLRVLDASPASEDLCPAYYRRFHFLFGPQLQRICTDYTTFTDPRWKIVPTHEYQHMLMQLLESAPHLLHLILYADAPPYTPTIVSAVSTAIRTFKNLVTARTGSLPIAEEALRHLAQLPHLEVVDVRLPDTMAEGDVAQCFHPTRYDDFFPSLREVWLAHRSDLAPISRVVRSVQSSQLEVIRAHLLDRKAPIPFNGVLSFLSVVLDRSNSANIKGLSVEASIKHTDPEARSTFTEDHLGPLFALRGLTHLSLRLRCSFELDDAILARVARAWPHIEVLELGPGVQWDTQVTLAALVPFAQHCPHLHTLGIPLNAELAGLPAEVREAHREGEGSVQRALKRLKVGHARMSDGLEREVAEFLVGLFPRLSDVENDTIPAAVTAVAVVLGATEEEVREEGRLSDRWLHVNNWFIPHMREWEKTLDEADALGMKREGPRRLP